MNTRFEKLMHRVQENLATDEERQELMQMVESGVFNEQIGDEWEKLLKINLESGYSEEINLNRELRVIRTKITFEEKSDYAKSYKRKSFTILGWVSAAAAVGLLLIIAVFWNKEVRRAEIVNPDIAQETSHGKTYSGKQFVNLPDGSTVILNEGSELKYEASFGDQIREVHLSGEAYFDIAHNPDIPFLVRTGKINTRVLSTAFNIEAWPGRSEVKVTVTRGKVSVGDDQQVYEELVPNEQLAVNTETEMFEKKKLDAEEAIEWKSSFLVLDKVTMEKAARQISKRYGVELFIENIKLRNCLVNGTFLENESVEHVISVLCLAMNATYEMKDEKIKIMGGIGCE